MKKFIISSFAVFALAGAFTASAAVTVAEMGSRTLRVGSRGSDVAAVQKALNECNGSNLATDGIFGRLTAAQFRAFQTAKMIKVDGLVGNQTKAALAACSTMTTPTTPVVTTTNGTEGYVIDFASDSSNRVSTVYESDTNKIVAGMRVTARLSDQKIETIKVTLKNHDTSVIGSSVNLAQYASSVSLMSDSTVIKTMTIAEADRSNTDDTYTFQFTGLGSAIAKDAIGRYYVAINANGGLDSLYAANADWVVNFADIRSTSPNGVYKIDTTATNSSVNGVAVAAAAGNYSAYQGTKFGFGKFSATGVKAEVALASSNPSAKTIAVSESSETKDQTVLAFKITAKNSDLTLRKVPVTLTLANNGAATLGDIVNTVKLMKGTEMIDNVDGSANVAGLYTFSNLSSSANTIAMGTTAEFSIVVDLKKQKNGVTVMYPVATNIKAALVNADILSSSTFSVMDKNGDQLISSSTYRTGSATGEFHTLVVDGVTASVTSKTAIAEDSTNVLVKSRLVASFNTTLTSTGGTVHIPAGAATAITVKLRDANTGISSVIAVGTTLVKADSDTVQVLPALGARAAGNYYEISGTEGFIFGLSEKSTTATGTIAPGTYSVELAEIKVYSADGSLVTIPVTGQLTNTVALN
jgi:hypothetical protein